MKPQFQFPYTDNNKRYHSFDFHMKNKFSCKVFKVSLNAGLSCPNIDGVKGIGGCSYCSPSGSGEFAGNPSDDIRKQFCEIKERMHKKWPLAKYIPYFQARTNTYAPVEYLKKIFEPLLEIPGVVGLSISTRPDALPDDVVKYLCELHERTYLTVELGLQSTYDKTLMEINRGHDFSEFLCGYEKLKKHGINICVHLINGLPFETKDMMLNNVRIVGKLNPHSIKLHLLHILENTRMAEQYKKNIFKTLSLSEYVDIICSQLEVLSPEIIIGRLTGDGAASDLIAPIWSLKKFVVLNEIDKEMKKRNSYQGCKCYIET